MDEFYELPSRFSEESACPDDLGTTVSVRLIGPKKQPVDGAQIGTWLDRAEFEWLDPRKSLEFRALDDREIRSDIEGRVDVKAAWLYRDEEVGKPVGPENVYAVHKERGLAVFTVLGPEDFKQKQSITVKMRPACQVKGRISSVGLRRLGKELRWTNTYISRIDGHYSRVAEYGTLDRNFSFLLPPGRYMINTYGTDTYHARRLLVIESGDEQRILRPDLPADRLAQLTGKSAPALREIQGWLHGEPVTLKELRGKIVVLDFWGYWCGPCIRAMPGLMGIHEEFADTCDVVFIAVHDDSVDSIEAMDEKLKPVREKVWDGRELPFRIALDGHASRKSLPWPFSDALWPRVRSADLLFFRASPAIRLPFVSLGYMTSRPSSKPCRKNSATANGAVS